MHNGERRSELDLRGPRKGLEIGAGSSRGVYSAWLFALIPTLTTKGPLLEVPREFRGGFHRNMEEELLLG
eukprot:9553812-Alexandrium_andersonii.AAC.1